MIWDQEKRRKLLAPRVSYELYKGPLSDGDLVLHSCDNPKCVNPGHLRLGSHKDKVADMDQRGRRVSPHLTGQTNPWSILTDAQVIQMRRDYLAGVKQDDIAGANGLSPNSVQDITLGRSWKHLLGLNGAPSLKELKAFAKVNAKSNARINQATADEIRRRLSLGAMGKDLAVEFGIHKATVSDIKRRKIWAD